MKNCPWIANLVLCFHLSFFGEFHSVVEDIQQDLLQALGISQEILRHVLSNVISDLSESPFFVVIST